MGAVAVFVAGIMLGHGMWNKIEKKWVRKRRLQSNSGIGLQIDGRMREDIVEMALHERRQRVYQAAPTIQGCDSETDALYIKTASEKELIIDALSSNIVFSNMMEKDVDTMIEYLEPESIPADSDVVVQGDPADYFYVIKEGQCTVLQGTKHVGVLYPGRSFGETGLLYNTAQTATVRTDVDSVLWKLDRATFRRQLAMMHVCYSSTIESTLRSAEILQGLKEGKLEKMIKAAVEVKYNGKQVIMKKGDKGSLGYFVMEGNIRVTDLPDGIPDMVYGPGDHFGLQALFTEDTRKETVVADTEKVSVLALCATDIGEILGDIKVLFLRDHEIRQLKSVPLLSEFSNDMLASLLASMELKAFSKGEPIINQGEIGTTFYLIQSGECDVIHLDEEGSGTVVKTLGALCYFGEMGLIKDEPRSADVVASTDCEVLEVGQATFKRIFGSSSSFSRQLQAVVKGRDRALSLVRDPPEKITQDQLKVVKVLGIGSFGTVNLVRHTKNGLFYAVKEMSIEFIESNRQQVGVIGEKENMQLCDHPFILKLYTTFKDRYTISFLVEYCAGGEMVEVMQKRSDNILPESHVKFYAGCELLALEHLALLSMAYRDIKPENTMLDSDGYCKMIDMGFAKVIKGKSYTFCGTPEYMAPEIILGTGHNRAVDYFALGVFIYEMLGGKTPFFDKNRDGVLRKVVRGRFTFGKTFSVEAKNLIQNLLEVDPSKRLGMRKGGLADIINHKWFSDLKFDDLLQKKIEAPWIPEEDLRHSDSSMDEEQPMPLLVVDDEDESSHGLWLDHI